MIKIAIAEDHQSLIDGIRLSLELEDDIQVVAEANDGEALIEAVRSKMPDVVITDIRMPHCDGIAATRIIKKEFPKIHVIAFSMFDQEEAIAQMKQAGASAYIMKNSSLSKVLEAIRTVVAGNTFYDDAIVTKNTENEQMILSNREKEILKLIGEGKTSQEISELLFLSKNTVDTHRKNISRKINFHGRNDLVRFAIERKYDF